MTEEQNNAIQDLLIFCDHKEATMTFGEEGRITYKMEHPQIYCYYRKDAYGICVYEPGAQDLLGEPGWFYLQCDRSLDHLAYVLGALRLHLINAKTRGNTALEVHINYELYDLLTRVINSLIDLSPRRTLFLLMAFKCRKDKLMEKLKNIH